MSSKQKIRVAITGNIGSGKSTFTKFLFEAGYPVILADDISKEILAGVPEVREEVIKEFGAQSYQGNKINKKYLVEHIFSDSKKLITINSILHPRVRKRIDYLSKEYFKTSEIVFVETALIFESKIEKMYDYVVLITAEKNIRMKRSTMTKKFSEEDFLKRDNNQMSEESKKKKADFVFTNEGSKDELKRKALLLINLLMPILH
ncbi:MAG: dephospho-CoA kinase [Ignavibacteriaceae bacterium]|jgi:dephospho-CoA kinase|nr:dephospho-CoA kinase [Ignavibacteriaceae bacterium]